MLWQTGCSQIPDGPARRLYSPEVAELLASALRRGLEARIVDKAAADARGAAYSASDNGHVSGGGGESEGESDGRVQVSTLRVGNNRFSSSSWRCMLEHLASHPPRELDLSFGSALPRCPAAAAASDAAASGTPGRAVTPSSGAAAAAAFSTESDVVPSAGSPESPEDPTPEQSLGELLAATVLPADAPGIEVLNLTGSTGLLLLQRPEVDGGDSAAEDDGEGGPSSSSPSCPTTAAFLVLLRDSLVSPLCRATHLLLSGVRGSSPLLRRETAPATAPSPSGPAGPKLHEFSPHDAKSLCEAASACASLRCLDLAGCDLSGPAGASAAAAAISCLTRNDDDDGYGVPVACALDRLSLRACGLGASGLSAVMRALTALPGDDGPGRRREGHQRPRLPCLLDLSGNRPLGGGAGGGALAASVDGAHRDRDAGGAGADQAAGLEDADGAALSELAASARALHLQGTASVFVTASSRWPPMRYFPSSFTA